VSSLTWLDNTLQIRNTANPDLTGIDDVQVFANPNAMMDRIIALNDYRNKARVVAGYCWDWVSKQQGTAGDHDIVFEEFGFRRHWNLSTDGSRWGRYEDASLRYTGIEGYDNLISYRLYDTFEE